MSLRIAGVKFDGPSKLDFCFWPVPIAVEADSAKRKMCMSKHGVKLERSERVLLGFWHSDTRVEILRLPVMASQARVGRGIIGIRADGLLEVFLGPLPLLVCTPHQKIALEVSLVSRWIHLLAARQASLLLWS